MTSLKNEKTLKKLKMPELKKMCQSDKKKYKGYSGLNKEDLIKHINKCNNKNNCKDNFSEKKKICEDINITLKPIIKWSGGKTDEINIIKPYIPNNYSTYLEPFVGGGALYFYLNPKKAVINDVHKELIYFYKAIKNGFSDEIYNYMNKHKNNEKTYYNVRSSECKNYIDSAKKFYYLRKTCYRGMLRYNKKGEFNIPFGRYKNCNYEDLKNKNYEKLLKNTDIFNEGFDYIFNNYNNSKNFMFLDPPYDSEFTDYGYCTFGKEEHKILSDYFKKTKIKCLMIIGKTPFIQELYKNYIVGEYDKNYRFKIHSGRIGKEINTKHLIIKNY